ADASIGVGHHDADAVEVVHPHLFDEIALTVARDDAFTRATDRNIVNLASARSGQAFDARDELRAVVDHDNLGLTRTTTPELYGLRRGNRFRVASCLPRSR